MKNSSLSKLVRKLHLRSPRTQSLHCLSSGWTRAAGGRWSPQFSRENGTTESGAFFPQKKGSQWTHSIPSRTERACSSPKHITHRSCVSSSVRQRWHGSTHLLKHFSTDIFLLTLQKQGPLKEKRGWCVPQDALYVRSFVLARRGFVRFIGPREVSRNQLTPPSDVCFLWCFVSTSKSPSSNSVYKIPCKNYLREISMTTDTNDMS